MLRQLSRYIILITLLAILKPSSANAYAILAHEAIVDASWEKEIKPLLKARFGDVPDSVIKLAHSYVYGGAMMADMGYLPGGSTYFSDLVHYVRSGDLINNLINESQNINEFAFALGALSHYRADEFGHSKATNLTVPLIYKELRKRYGDFVTYGDNPVAHSRTEFSFDVLQIARGNYNSQAYHDFIGFNIAKPVLERAVLLTYGETLDELFGNFEGSVKTFRWGVKNLMPTLIRKTWHSQRDSILKRQPGITAKTFKYKMKKREFHQEFGRGEAKPGFWANTLSWLINALPKIGPLKTLKYVDPGKQGEALFIHSFDTILVKYAQDLHAVQNHNLILTDIDFDTGRITRIGEYDLADQTYAALLVSLQQHQFQHMTPVLKQHLLNFYADPNFIPASEKYQIKCDEVEKALTALKTAQPLAQQ